MSVTKILNSLIPIVHEEKKSVTVKSIPTGIGVEYIKVLDITNTFLSTIIYVDGKINDHDGEFAINHYKKGKIIQRLSYTNGVYNRYNESYCEIPYVINYNTEDIVEYVFSTGKPKANFTIKVEKGIPIIYYVYSDTEDQMVVYEEGDGKIRLNVCNTNKISDVTIIRNGFNEIFRKLKLDSMIDIIERTVDDDISRHYDGYYSDMVFYNNILVKKSIYAHDLDIEYDNVFDKVYMIQYYNNGDIKSIYWNPKLLKRGGKTMMNVAEPYVQKFYENRHKKYDCCYVIPYEVTCSRKWKENGDLYFRSFLNDTIKCNRSCYFSSEYQYSMYSLIDDGNVVYPTSEKNDDDLMYMFLRVDDAVDNFSKRVPLPHLECIYSDRYRLCWFSKFGNFVTDYTKAVESGLYREKNIQITPTGRIVTTSTKTCKGLEKIVSYETYIDNNEYKMYRFEKYVDGKLDGNPAVVDMDRATFVMNYTAFYILGEQTLLLQYNNKNVLVKTSVYKKCKICYERLAQHVNYCGHIYCLQCWDKMTNCPLCKQEKKNVFKYYN